MEHGCVKTYPAGETMDRLGAVDLDACEGSHAMLSEICSAVCTPPYGWTRGACESLRGRLEAVYASLDGDMEMRDFCSRLETCARNGEAVTLFGVDYVPVADRDLSEATRQLRGLADDLYMADAINGSNRIALHAIAKAIEECVASRHDGEALRTGDDPTE